MAVGTTKVVQVTNIAPQATKDQMHILFGYLGKIEDIRLYPTIRDVSCPVQSRICYIKFVDPSTVGIAQHMTNTVFIDRALIVVPVSNGDIPDEYYALEMTRNGTIVPGLTPNDPKLPKHVNNTVYGSGADQVILTTDPNIVQNDLPPYPPLPANYDSAKIEATRRTILMLDYDSNDTNDEIIDFFSTAGEVKYIRTCKRQSDNANHMLIEFSDQPSVINALKLNGKEFKGKKIQVQHATQPIVVPQAKSNEAAQKEIEEAMTRFKEAQNMINASIEPVIGMLTKDKRSSRRSRSRSRGRRRRSRSRSRSRRSRSRRRRSVSRKRSRSRERRRRSHSRRRRSRSRSRRSRSRSRSRRTRSKSRKRSRHPSRDRSKEKIRAASRERTRKSRDRSKERKRYDKDRKSKERESKESRGEPSVRDSKEKKSDKESSVDTTVAEKKRSRSRSVSRRRSRSRERKSRDRKRSRSRGGKKKTPSPKRKRSRSKSKDKKREKKSHKKDKESKTKDRRSRSKSKIPRNYDEEEKGFDAEKKEAKEEVESPKDKGSPEKSDNMDISNSP